MNQVFGVLSNKPFLFVVAFTFLTGQTLLLGDDDSSDNNGDIAINFNRDIRPILSDTCFKCHGPDSAERHAGLRLDTKAGMEAAADLIAAGEPDNSEFVARITSADADELMPPPDSGRKLTAQQKQLLKVWVKSGAKWKNHWSFVAPEKAKLPHDSKDDWSRNEIDRFVFRKLRQKQLAPNDRADRNTLIRRLCLDLTGLPPESKLLDRYVASDSVSWYEGLVNELLGSEHYGEHMARFWLDAARYADTHGLHLDNYREMWLYRDWVIDAFNENLSFRDFVIHQLAGDLLANPTDDQLVATGFNRAHVSTNEGGSIADEVKVRNVVDRVSTTGTVFMGLTIGCAQCHDHKYDPISQKDFYSMYAFFNSLDGNPMDGNRKDHAPIYRYFDTEKKEQLDSWKAEQAQLKSKIDNLITGFTAGYVDPIDRTPSEDWQRKIQNTDSAEDFVWVDDELPDGAKKTGEWKIDKESVQPFSGESVYVENNKAISQIVLTDANPRLRFRSEDTFFVYAYLDSQTPPKQIMVQFNDGVWEHRAYWGKNIINFGKDKTPSRLRIGDLPETGKWHRLEIKAKDVGFKNTTSIHGIAFSQHGGKVFWDSAGVVTNLPQSYSGKSLNQWLAFQSEIEAMDLPKDLRRQFTKEKDTADFQAKIKDHFLRNVHPDSKQLIAEPNKKLAELKTKIDDVTNKAPTTLIWKEKKNPVQAHILNRGEYDQKGEAVQRATPGSLPNFPTDLPNDRLGLAKWLVSDEHPLTSRVTVNRFWQQLFGTGLVATSEDFGSQGELPSHPELLDWLAVEFRDNDWDVKALIRNIVMSATYRQASVATRKKIELDPENRFFSRGPRYRLDAETLRDQALSVAKILVPTIGGPAVKPPQPDGLWFAVGYSRSNTVRFKKDNGNDKVHRRSLYTFWKRTAPPPQMSTLDAPSRESCLVRRERTNTPLQALLLMNDPQYVEAARHFAQTAIDAGLQSDEAVVEFMYRQAMSAAPTSSQLKIMAKDLKRNITEFTDKPEAAKQLIAIGELRADEKYDPVLLASYTMLANLIMNQDEFITKN